MPMVVRGSYFEVFTSWPQTKFCPTWIVAVRQRGTKVYKGAFIRGYIRGCCHTAMIEVGQSFISGHEVKTSK